MILKCKKCGFLNYDPYNSLSECEHCSKDPRSGLSPLVLDSLKIQVRSDIDGERKVFVGKDIDVVNSKFSSTLDLASITVNELFRTNIVDEFRTNKISSKAETTGFVYVSVKKGANEFCFRCTEEDFLELFEPVDYPHFWREDETEPEPNLSDDDVIEAIRFGNMFVTQRWLKEVCPGPKLLLLLARLNGRAINTNAPNKNGDIFPKHCDTPTAVQTETVDKWPIYPLPIHSITPPPADKLARKYEIKLPEWPEDE